MITKADITTAKLKLYTTLLSVDDTVELTNNEVDIMFLLSKDTAIQEKLSQIKKATDASKAGK